MSFDPDQLAASYNPDTDIEADPLAGKKEEYRIYRRETVRVAQTRYRERHPDHNKWRLYNQHRVKYCLEPFSFPEWQEYIASAPKDSKGRVIAAYTRQQLEKEYERAYGVKR